MNHPLFGQAASLIRETFVVTDEQAEDEARGLLDFIESKGGVPNDWGVVREQVLDDLGLRLPWRKAEEKAAVDKRRTDTVAAYNAHLDTIRPSWSKKW